MAENALIIFSRLPIGRETKTRLAPLLTEEQRRELHLAMWRDLFPEALKLRDNTDTFLYWTGSGRIADYAHIIPRSFILREQQGETLGARMSNALHEVLESGYSRAVLIGSDLPELRAQNLRRAFELLDEASVVLGPSYDGGYWLIGMHGYFPEAFCVQSWGHSDVLSATIGQLTHWGITYALADTLRDMDTPEDVKEFLLSKRNVQGVVYKFLRVSLSFSRGSLGSVQRR